MLALTPFLLLVPYVVAAPVTTPQPIVTNCKHNFALTFSEGMTDLQPTYNYYWAQASAKVTYFITGNKNACIYDNAVVTNLKNTYAANHQLASAGWSGADLTKLTYAEIDTEITRLNDAFVKILGVKPKFYRPPTLAAMNDDVAAYLQSKYGMTIVTWSDDSNDVNLPRTSRTGLYNWYMSLVPAGQTQTMHITQAHEVSQGTYGAMVTNQVALSYRQKGVTMLTVASCIDSTPYETVTGVYGAKDDTWTCTTPVTTTTTSTTSTTSTTTSTTAPATTSTTTPPTTTSTTAPPTTTSTTAPATTSTTAPTTTSSTEPPTTTTTTTSSTPATTSTTTSTTTDPATTSTTPATTSTTTDPSTTSTTPTTTSTTTDPSTTSTTPATTTDPSTTSTPATTTSTTSAAPTQTGPTTLASYNGWDSVGCYVDDGGDRKLPVALGTLGGTAAMTAELCLDACHAVGYEYAGLEWSQECFCGRAPPPEPATDGRCNMVCNGNPLQYCGGSLGLSVYRYTAAPPVSGPSTVRSYNAWTYTGCYEDFTANRALPVPVAVTGAMTVERCLDACQAAGYSIGGIEWSQECYCGSSMPTKVATDGRCDMTCNGNPLQLCGGGLGLSVYQRPAPATQPSTLQSYKTWTHDNCYVDSIQNRALSIGMPVTGVMTVELCLDACSAAGYEYAGLEYSQECYCGKTRPTEVATDGRCSMVCQGNPLEYCGGGNGLTLYHSSVPSNGPAVLQSYNGWTSSGCYVDSIFDRALPYGVGTINGNTMTVGACLDACHNLGYRYAGLEYAQECYCGTIMPQQQATDGRCNMACKGNSLEYCGGGNGLNLYSYAVTTF